MIVVWEYSAVVEVYKRHHLLKDVAIEIFLSDGQTYLIVFEEQAVICFAGNSLFILQNKAVFLIC